METAMKKCQNTLKSESSVEEEIARRSFFYAMDNMRKHSIAETQQELLDDKLMATVLRLKQAHIHQRGSYQYLLGLKCLIFWELKQLYAYYSAGCVIRVQRNTLRHRYFADPESRLMFPEGIRMQMREEYEGMVENGTDPEDNYADMLDDDEEDEEVEEHTDGVTDDAEGIAALGGHQQQQNSTVGQQQPSPPSSQSSDYEEERIVFPERLHCFVAWDLFNRAN